MKILAIDDDPVVLEVLRASFVEEGHVQSHLGEQRAVVRGLLHESARRRRRDLQLVGTGGGNLSSGVGSAAVVVPATTWVVPPLNGLPQRVCGRVAAAEDRSLNPWASGLGASEHRPARSTVPAGAEHRRSGNAITISSRGGSWHGIGENMDSVPKTSTPISSPSSDRRYECGHPARACEPPVLPGCIPCLDSSRPRPVAKARCTLSQAHVADQRFRTPPRNLLGFWLTAPPISSIGLFCRGILGGGFSRRTRPLRRMPRHSGPAVQAPLGPCEHTSLLGEIAPFAPTECEKSLWDLPLWQAHGPERGMTLRQ